MPSSAGSVSPGRPGIRGSNSSACSPGIRRADLVPRWAPGRRAARTSRLCARVWDAPVIALDLEALADAPTRCSWRCPIMPPRRSRRRSSRAASVSSISPALSGCATPSCGSAGIRRRRIRRRPVVYGLTEHNREPTARCTLVACAGCYPTAAILALQPLVEGGPGRRPDHHRREVGRVGRRQDADRTHAFQRMPRQPLGLRRVRASPRRRNRAGARRGGHVRAAPAADRSRHSRNDLCDAAARARRGDVAAALQAAYADRRSCG